MSWHNLFIPHRETHEKAQLLNWHAVAIYVLLFILLQVSFSIIGYAKPGVLGITSNVNQKLLIELTNQERQKAGLPLLRENAFLDAAAKAKAENMFKENYWAHFAPSGKTPWDFITTFGYKFVYAGENLAKSFYNSEDVVEAWMNSPTHKENIVNSKYQDIGIAVVEGELNGQKTTLVVQMFGATENLAALPNAPSGQQLGLAKQIDNAVESKVLTKEQKITNIVVDPYQVSKMIGLGLIGFLSILLIVDFIIIRRRGIHRLAAHNLAHLSLLSAAAITVIQTHPGNIL